MTIFQCLPFCALSGFAFYVASPHQRLFSERVLSARSRSVVQCFGAACLCFAGVAAGLEMRVETALFALLSVMMVVLGGLPWLAVLVSLPFKETRQ